MDTGKHGDHEDLTKILENLDMLISPELTLIWRGRKGTLTINFYRIAAQKISLCNHWLAYRNLLSRRTLLSHRQHVSWRYEPARRDRARIGIRSGPFRHAVQLQR